MQKKFLIIEVFVNTLNGIKNIVVHVYVKKLFDQFAVKEDSLKHTLSSLRNTPIGLQKWYSSQRFGIQTVSQTQVMLYLYYF